MSEAARLFLVLRGEAADRGQVPAEELWRLVKELQDSLSRVAYVLWTGGQSGPPSAIPAAVRAITELELVVPARSGSVEMEFILGQPPGPIGLKLEQESQQAPAEAPPDDIGVEALRTLVDGVRLLAQSEEPRLPLGIDRRTLQSIARAGEALRPLETLDLLASSSSFNAEASLDRSAAEHLRALRHQPLMSDTVSVTGTLVPSHGQAMRLLTLAGDEVILDGSASAIEALQQFAGDAMTVAGEALLTPSRDAPEKLWLRTVRRAEARDIDWDRFTYELADTGPSVSPGARRSGTPRPPEPTLWSSETEFDDSSLPIGPNGARAGSPRSNEPQYGSPARHELLPAVAICGGARPITKPDLD
jgi:hypothetical protein